MKLDHLELAENGSPFRSWRVGDVTSVDIIKRRKSGKSNGFAFVTMSAQSEADKAVGMFNAYSLDGHYLRVTLITSRKQCRFGRL